MGLDVYNDSELIYMMRQKDKKAEEILYQKYIPIVGSWIKERLIVELFWDEYDDITNHLMGCVLIITEKFNDNKGFFYSYAKACVDNILKRYICNYSKRKNILSLDQLVDDNGDNVLFVANANPNYEKMYLLQEEIEGFIEDSKLEPMEKLVVSYLLKGYSYKEIADILKVSIKVVDNSCFRARQKIRKSMKER